MGVIVRPRVALLMRASITNSDLLFKGDPKFLPWGGGGGGGLDNDVETVHAAT